MKPSPILTRGEQQNIDYVKIILQPLLRNWNMTFINLYSPD